MSALKPMTLLERTSSIVYPPDIFNCSRQLPWKRFAIRDFGQGLDPD